MPREVKSTTSNGSNGTGRDKAAKPKAKRGDGVPEPALAPEDLIYGSDEFYVPATDGRGHHATITLRVPPGLVRQIEEILATHKFPAYKTISDFARHAILRHVYCCRRWEPGMQMTYLGGLALLQRTAADDLYMAETERMFVDIEGRVKYHLSNGELGEAVKLLAVGRAHLVRVPECYWKRRTGERFKAEFGYLMEQLAPQLDSGTNVSPELEPLDEPPQFDDSQPPVFYPDACINPEPEAEEDDDEPLASEVPE